VKKWENDRCTERNEKLGREAKGKEKVVVEKNTNTGKPTTLKTSAIPLLQ
jgi:hypothetical protein